MNIFDKFYIPKCWGGFEKGMVSVREIRMAFNGTEKDDTKPFPDIECCDVLNEFFEKVRQIAVNVYYKDDDMVNLKNLYLYIFKKHVGDEPSFKVALLRDEDACCELDWDYIMSCVRCINENPELSYVNENVLESKGYTDLVFDMDDIVNEELRKRHSFVSNILCDVINDLKHDEVCEYFGIKDASKDMINIMSTTKSRLRLMDTYYRFHTDGKKEYFELMNKGVNPLEKIKEMYEAISPDNFSLDDKGELVIDNQEIYEISKSNSHR